MRKITTLFLCCFVCIFYQKSNAQTIDVSDFFIISQSPLTQEKEALLDYFIQDFNIGLKENLTAKGYTVINAPSRLYATELYGHRVPFDSKADKIMFGRVLHDDMGRLSFITYLCDINRNTGIPVLEALKAHTASGNINLWENEGERYASIVRTSDGLLNSKNTGSFVSEETYLTTSTASPVHKTPQKIFAVEVEKQSTSGSDLLSRKDELINVVETPQITSTPTLERNKQTAKNKKMGHQ